MIEPRVDAVYFPNMRNAGIAAGTSERYPIMHGGWTVWWPFTSEIPEIKIIIRLGGRSIIGARWCSAIRPLARHFLLVYSAYTPLLPQVTWIANFSNVYTRTNNSAMKVSSKFNIWSAWAKLRPVDNNGNVGGRKATVLGIVIGSEKNNG